MVKCLLVGLISLLVLAGCGESKEQTIARCHMEAQKIWPQSQTYNDPLMRGYVEDCMTVAGYHFISIQRCWDSNGAWKALQRNCYESGLERFWHEDVLGKPAS